MPPGSNPKRDVIEKCIALKKMPHVYNKVKSVWGYPEFFTTVDDLLMMEQGRENRAGFPRGVYKELQALKLVFLKFPDQVMSPYLGERDRKKIKQIIEHVNTRKIFATRDGA